MILMEFEVKFFCKTSHKYKIREIFYLTHDVAFCNRNKFLVDIKFNKIIFNKIKYYDPDGI